MIYFEYSNAVDSVPRREMDCSSWLGIYVILFDTWLIKCVSNQNIYSFEILFLCSK